MIAPRLPHRERRMTISRVNDAFPPGGYPLIRALAFASCYVYSPTGLGTASARSRSLCGLLKAADIRFIGKYANRVRELVAAGAPLSGFLGPHDVLMPVPGSAPQLRGMPSAAGRLAEALVCQGVGEAVWCGLHRLFEVPKSATAAPGCRPTVAEHFESLVVDTRIQVPDRLVLVDDVITKGRTLLAAAARVREAYPHVPIGAFALLRTMGFVQEVTRFLEPCVGEIRWRSGDAIRSP